MVDRRGTRPVGWPVVPLPSAEGRVPVARWTFDPDTGEGRESTDGEIDLVSGTFHPSGSDGPTPFLLVVDLGDGLRVITTVSAPQALPEVRVEDAGGDVLLDAEGFVLPPDVDDGDADPLVMHTGTALEAVDLASGDLVWSYPDATGSPPLARMGGVVLVRTADGHAGLDDATGEELWRRGPEPDHAAVTPLGGDGERLLVLRQDASPREQLVALDLRTGAELWTQDLDIGDVLHALGGEVVVVRAGGGLRMLR